MSPRKKTLTPNLIEHPIWPQLAPYFAIEHYSKDGKGRKRVELKKIADAKLLDEAKAVQVPCACCGKAMSPIRERGDGSLYLAAACPLAVSVKCSRSPKASTAYAALAEAMAGRVDLVEQIRERKHC